MGAGKNFARPDKFSMAGRAATEDSLHPLLARFPAGTLCRRDTHESFRMKLGFVLFEYFPFGGLQRDCRKIAELCAARGHAVTIFTHAWKDEQPTTVKIELLSRRDWTNVRHNHTFLK